MSTTGGIGGMFTNVESGWWYASNDYASKYRIFAEGIDQTKPIGLFVWLHGDGAYEYNNPTDTAYLFGPDGIIQAARDENMITVVPLSPDDDGAVTWWEWGHKTGNAQWLKELITSVFYQSFDIDLTKIWFGGFSGGAEFLTAQFLPFWGNDLQIEGGGAVITGGGDHAAEYGGNTAFTPNFSSGFRMYWRTGEDDTAANSSEGFDAVEAAHRGENWYRGLGFATDIELVSGHSHLLNGLYGGFIREALNDVPLGFSLADAKELFVGSDPVKEVYVGDVRVWKASDNFFSYTEGPIPVEDKVVHLSDFSLSQPGFVDAIGRYSNESLTARWGSPYPQLTFTNIATGEARDVLIEGQSRSLAEREHLQAGDYALTFSRPGREADYPMNWISVSLADEPRTQSFSHSGEALAYGEDQRLLTTINPPTSSDYILMIEILNAIEGRDEGSSEYSQPILMIGDEEVRRLHNGSYYIGAIINGSTDIKITRKASGSNYYPKFDATAYYYPVES